jgi:predicted phage-related endonuclease
MKELVKRYVEIKNEMKLLEDELNDIKDKLYNMVEDDIDVEIDDKVYKVKPVVQVREYVDKRKLAKEYPDILPKVATKRTVRYIQIREV